jgi:hypothetical protein
MQSRCYFSRIEHFTGCEFRTGVHIVCTGLYIPWVPMCVPRMTPKVTIIRDRHYEQFEPALTSGNAVPTFTPMLF